MTFLLPRFGLFYFCSCVSNEHQGPSARASFANRNLASAMMTSRLKCDGAQLLGGPLLRGCPLFPRQLMRHRATLWLSEHDRRSAQVIFSLRYRPKSYLNQAGFAATKLIPHVPDPFLKKTPAQPSPLLTTCHVSVSMERTNQKL